MQEVRPYLHRAKAPTGEIENLSLESMNGPTFLLFFFVKFCAFGVLTPILRSIWLDTDVFNYLAVGTLEAAGMVRVIHALLERNYRISFLLLGMVLIPLVFLLPRTENSNESSESFRSKQGGLALVPYVSLFISILLALC